MRPPEGEGWRAKIAQAADPGLPDFGKKSRQIGTVQIGEKQSMAGFAIPEPVIGDALPTPVVDAGARAAGFENADETVGSVQENGTGAGQAPTVPGATRSGKQSPRKRPPNGDRIKMSVLRLT